MSRQTAERGVSMQRLPAARRWTIYLALAVGFAIACGFLADWQFSRNDARSAQLALIERNYDAAPVPLASVIGPSGTLDARDEWRPVVMRGEYLSDQQLVVRNRPRGGTSAFEVLTPLRLQDGRVVIVDRGWVPPAAESPEPDTIPAPPAGEVTVIGRLRPSEPLPASGRGAPDGQVATINVPLIAEATGAGTVTGAYVLMAAEDPAPASRPAPIDPPASDPGFHLSYAVQWILFAVMGFGFVVYVIRTEARHRREDAEDLARVAEAGGPPVDPAAASSPIEQRRRERARRRRDRDMQDEDAILDSATRG